MFVRTCALLLTGFFAAATTTAQARHDGGTIECRSSNYKYTECQTGFRGAGLVRQLSDTDCVQDKTWGFNNETGRVWVSGGCAGEFGEGSTVDQGAYDSGDRDRHRQDRDRDRRDDDDDGSVACASSGHRFQRCDVRWRGAHLVRQLSDSACIEDQSWGVDGEGLWVDQGCSGRFVEARGGDRRSRRDEDDRSRRASSSFTCESQGGGRERCALPRGTREGDVVVDEQLSNTPCRRGENWDYDDRELWVSGGCRARFSVQ